MALQFAFPVQSFDYLRFKLSTKLSIPFPDQQFNQLEKQLISCNNKLEHEARSNEELKKNLDETGKFGDVSFGLKFGNFHICISCHLRVIVLLFLVEALELRSKQLREVESLKETAHTNYVSLWNVQCNC